MGLVLDLMFFSWDRLLAGWVSGFAVRFWIVVGRDFVFVGEFR